MKTTVFTLMTALVLSTTTCLAQPSSGRGSCNRDNGRQQYTERGMNNNGRMDRGRGGQYADDMYGVAPGHGGQPQGMRGRHHGGGHYGRPVPVPPPPPAPRVVERVVYPAPAPCAPVPPPPPVPHHTVHVAPAGVVAGAVIGSVIGAILSH